ncbi:nuclear pore complex protein GP210 isoform X2 [Tripterygium wilfordii]|uniref:nuclear pore complex protein GP210 isoform X2 n=1 Tax=Tripterygium wilfordii TaxID=458696 RepID=UPI0018F82A41|nr:nuclear pore complex protein GP210 isoform X2 [Tripterygium wilfordii]
MARLASLIVLLLLHLVVHKTTSHSGSGPHIADVNILLPPKMTYPVEYRLQGSDGCFKWSWDHHDILSVVPEYNLSSHCSTSARLKSVAPYSGRKETAVYAADVHTGIVIRCKVFIDNFSRIQIFHNSIKLDLDGLATLRVRAFDSEENVFSSLVGLQFTWQLIPETGGLPHHLVHVPLKESPLSDCGGLCGDLDIQIELEDSGVFSDLFVVKGIGIGHENVSVNLLEPQFNHMGDEIVLTVAEAMSLDPPSPVFVLIGAMLQYVLKVIRGNYPQVVMLPSPHHRWSVSNSTVAQVDPMVGLTRALSLGVTVVVVEDTRVAGHIQMSSLNVVLPDTLSLYLLPLSSTGDPINGVEPIPPVAHWYVVAGRQYLIQMKVFSQGPGAQEIYITENDDVELHDKQSEYWKTFLAPDNVMPQHGWKNARILEATSHGMGKLTSYLSYFTGHHDRKKVLKVVQEIFVCNQVRFSLDKMTGTSQGIILPWAPAVYQEIELRATGGCAKTSSDYKWFSSDMTIVSISASGVLQAMKPGKVTIKAVSIFDPLNLDEVVAEVSVPASMVMLPNFPVETVVGSHLQSAVTMKAPNGAHFYACDAFSSYIKWKAESQSFIVVNGTKESFPLLKQGDTPLSTSEHGPPCSWTYIYASGPGQTMLHATLLKEYQHDLSYHGPTILKASSRIAAYPPLVVHQVGDGSRFGGYSFGSALVGVDKVHENLKKLYLVPGTQLDVILLGGPDRWDDGVDFIETVEILNDKHALVGDGIHVHLLPGNHETLSRIFCETLGTFKLVFKRGNLVGDDHPVPAIEEVSLSLICAFPSTIVLIVDEPVNERDAIQTAIQADRASGRVRVTPVTVANGQRIRIAAVGITDSGEAFANSSSLSLSWELSSCGGLAYWDDNDPQMARCKWERFLVLQNESGLCVVRATVVGFCDSLAGYYSSQLPGILVNTITDAVRLQLVSLLSINPEFSLLFFHPNAQANLSINGGSCFLEVSVNDSKVVEVVQPSPVLQCSQLMVSPKGLGTALVTVYDIGLSPPVAASAVVQVADVDWLEIVSGGEINLMEGMSQSIALVAGNNDGNTFSSSQYAYMNIHVHIENHIVKLVDNDISSPGGGHVSAPNFTIVAQHLGITTLYVSARQQSGLQILSQPIKIEVYPPPLIHPHDIFLVPGASYVLTVEGGPSIGVYIEYASLDDKVATVDRSTGKLLAILPGNTTLLVTLYGNGGGVICQAHGSVKVGVPSSVVLNVQSKQLSIGNDMPIYPFFPEGNLFSFYELCKDYKWTVEDEKVLRFHVADHGVPLADLVEVQPGYFDVNQLDFVKVLLGRSAGRTNVAVTFSCDFLSDSYSQSRIYNASVSISVVSDLPLALGVPITWVLPPRYTTSALLPSCTETQIQKNMQGCKGAITYSLLRACGEHDKVSHNDAISIDGDKIKTMESNNLACIQAKDRITERIEIVSCVRVAEIAQIRTTSKDFPFHVINLAVGAELELPISYRDPLGNPFYEAHNIVLYHVETNYPDIVSVDNTSNGSGKVHLKVLRHGRALVQVSMSSNPQKSDYILISAGAHVHPQNPVLRVGRNLNFSIAGGDSQVSGSWLSANESVISIDMPSGKAEAIGVGSTKVFFKCPTMKLQTKIEVLPRDVISVDAPNELLTNVPLPTKGYRFPLKFRTYDEFEALEKGRGVPYDCEVDPPFVGHAKPWMDLETSYFYCLFFPYSPEDLARSAPKSRNKKPYVSVSINASLKEAKNVSGSASVLFIGGFSVLGMHKNSMQLDLTPDSNETIITILGNTDVEIFWHDQDSIAITPIYKEDFGVGGHAQYKVKVIRPRRFKDKIIIMLPANGQRAEIDVNCELGEQAASETSISVSPWASVAALFFLLVLTVGIFICFLDKRPNRSQPSMRSTSQSISAPVTPERPSSVVLNEQSPRTPPPFVDYVRRTIDETPYYKREARRRFNPQNTF